MINKARHIGLLVLIVFSFQYISAQSVSAKASIDSGDILIGEPIRLVLEVSVPHGVKVDWFPLDSIPHFEFIDKGKIDTVAALDGKLFRQMITITSFDSGKWYIPPLPLKADGNEIFTDSLPVTVSFSEFDAQQDYHDIKDIIIVDNPFTKYINWALILITILALVLAIYFLRKKIKTPKTPGTIINEPLLSPLQEALDAMKRLQKQPLQSAEDVKTYYTELNEIVRKYWWRKTGWAAGKKTNEELIGQLSSATLLQDDRIAFAQQLRMADAVKFAKYIPSFEENTVAFEITRKSIQLLDKILK